MFRRSPRASQRGFTLFELLTTLSVAGVLAAVGMPAMGSFHGKAVVDAQVQSLSSAMRRARQEAITRGELVTVCAMDPATAESTEPDCLASGKNWSAGWIVFVDRGRRGEIGSSDRVIAVHQSGDNKGGALSTQRYVTYRAGGEMLSLASHFRFLPPGQPLEDAALPGSVLVCINKPGRPRVAHSRDCEG
jgi:type IV fimbrial biogenesis protein FimT